MPQYAKAIVGGLIAASTAYDLALADRITDLLEGPVSEMWEARPTSVVSQ